MKIVILAGGMRSTLNNDREWIPKPMVQIGGKPILWHIMKHFSEYGGSEFIICGGYRIDMIKEYFMDFYIYQSDITIDLQNNKIEIHKPKTEDWKVTVVDTGLFASTGQRVSRIQKYIQEDNFMVVYGDCLSDIDMRDFIKVHEESGKIATAAVVKPSGRNELLPLSGSNIFNYGHMLGNDNEEAWINADCIILRKEAFAYLQGNYDLKEQLFVKLSEKQQLAAYKHRGYWTAIDTKRDLEAAENLWNAGMAPWTK